MDNPRCLWRPEGERMKGDPNVTNIDVSPDAQETARQGTRARERSGLEVIETGPPIDVLWFRLPRREEDPEESSSTAATTGRPPT